MSDDLLSPADATPADSTHRSLRLIGLLAGLGLHPAAVEVLADLSRSADAAGLDADARHWLAGPLVVHDSAWNADCPLWLRRQALEERWLIAAGDLPGHLIGPSELVCVMFGAMMDAPRDHDLSRLYLWASAHAVRRRHGDGSTQALAAAALLDGASDADFLPPGACHRHVYAGLCEEVRRKVAAASRARGKADRAASRAARPAADRPSAIVLDAASAEAPCSAQFDLFAGA